MAILQHYGLPTKALDVTFDSNVALWFALSMAEREGERLRFKAAQETGYVYALWVPVTYDWNGDRGNIYRWSRSKGHESSGSRRRSSLRSWWISPPA